MQVDHRHAPPVSWGRRVRSSRATIAGETTVEPWRIGRDISETRFGARGDNGGQNSGDATPRGGRRPHPAGVLLAAAQPFSWGRSPVEVPQAHHHKLESVRGLTLEVVAPRSPSPNAPASGRPPSWARAPAVRTVILRIVAIIVTVAIRKCPWNRLFPYCLVLGVQDSGVAWEGVQFRREARARERHRHCSRG